MYVNFKQIHVRYSRCVTSLQLTDIHWYICWNSGQYFY